jgi:hypothetical protein
MTQINNEQKYIILFSFIEQNKNRKFEWGKWDCCLFVCDYLNLIIDKDLAKSFRGKYSTEIGAYKQIKKQGYKHIKHMCNIIFKENGINKKNINKANRTDIILFDNAIGLCLGLKSVFLTPEGMTFIDTYKCDICWGYK